jgi:hypothetical protein
MMEAARTSETLVNLYQTTRCYNPEDSHLYKHYCYKKPFPRSKFILEKLIFAQMLKKCPVFYGT